MTEPQFKIVGIGEILWDCLPSGKTLGGAPANFAYTAEQLGNQGIIVSRIGGDTAGAELLNDLANKKIKSDFVQLDREHSTGLVQVELHSGQPVYQILENAAWDFLELNADLRRLAAQADAVCFGSLAQRSTGSHRTIQDFLALTRRDAWRVFDVNLRQDYFSFEILSESLRAANIVKLNHEELKTMAQIFQLTGANEIELVQNIRHSFELKLVCLTKEANGSLLAAETEISKQTGAKIELKDAIGAGDAFTAGLIHGLLRGWSLEKVNAFANRVGGFVASQTGAMPDFSFFVEA